jgi:FkbH-like protein
MSRTHSDADRLKDLQRLWRSHMRRPVEPGPADAAIGIAASFTVDPLVPYLGARLVEGGVRSPELRLANYNQLIRVCNAHEQELTGDPLSAIVLLFRLEDLADTGSICRVKEALDLLCESITRLRDRFPGQIIIGLPPRPRPFIEAVAGFSRASGLASTWFEALQRIATLSKSTGGLYTIDLEAIVAMLGEADCLDHRKELLYRQPYAECFYSALSEALVRVYLARRREPKKCLVLDCDNTLWGGIVGEDGVGGVQLSDDFPGSAFRHFQRQLLGLRHSGVFLALNSKNNPDDVWEMFDRHPGMVLRRDDISAARINWRPKSENLKEIASELNIGADALVFVDDNPFEIEEVRANAPEVTCVQLPPDQADIPLVLHTAGRHFDRLDVTADDRARVDMMREETNRRELAQKLSEADFLASLDLEVEIFTPTPADIARVTQLVNKTNQFNVTTRRYSAEEIVALVEGDRSEVVAARVRDRFGEYGLVGIVILRHQGPRTEIDSLLMSCRVLSRGIETAMLASAIEAARACGAREILGRYIPTRKNAMVADLFQRHGFAETHQAIEASEQLWLRDLAPLPVPDYLRASTCGLALGIRAGDAEVPAAQACETRAAAE